MFKLAPFGNGQLFNLTAPDLRVPGIPDDVLQQVSQPSGSKSHGQCVKAAPSPRRFAALRVEAPLFAVLPFYDCKADMMHMVFVVENDTCGTRE